MKTFFNGKNFSTARCLVLITGFAALATYTYDTFTNAHGPSILLGMIVCVVCWFTVCDKMLAYICYWVYSVAVIGMAILGVWMIMHIEKFYNRRMDLYVIAVVRGLFHIVTLVCLARERARMKKS